MAKINKKPLVDTRKSDGKLAPAVDLLGKRNKAKIKSGKPTKYKKIAHVGSDDRSIQLISNVVRTFKISINALSRWSMFEKVYNNKLLHMKFLDERVGAEISLLIDFIFPDNKKFSDEELYEIVYLLGSQFVNSSLEGKVDAIKLDVKNGKGVMTSFTNINHNREYRHTTKGVIYKDEWLIQFTLKSNNLQSFNHKFALQSLVNSISIQKL